MLCLNDGRSVIYNYREDFREENTGRQKQQQSGQRRQQEQQQEEQQQKQPEDHWSWIAHLTAEDMLKSAAVIEKRRLNIALGQGQTTH